MEPPVAAEFESVWLPAEGGAPCVKPEPIEHVTVKVEPEFDFPSQEPEGCLNEDVLQDEVDVKKEFTVEEHSIDPVGCNEENGSMPPAIPTSELTGHQQGPCATDTSGTFRNKQLENIKVYKCTSCSKCFNRSDRLNQHLRNHTGEKPYGCNECNRHFSRIDHLKQHLKTHTVDRPYKCNDCDKSFRRSDYLYKHQKIHSKERPYRCNECMKCFSLSSYLQQHLRTHTGEKPYTCSECSKHFRCYDHLSRHTKMHIRLRAEPKEHRCKECNRCFSRSSDLAQHVHMHSRKKPLTCKECDSGMVDCSHTTHLCKHIKPGIYWTGIIE